MKPRKDNAWQKWAFNVTTETFIFARHSGKDDNGKVSMVYKCNSRAFRTFREAVLETAKHGNSAGDFILLNAFWKNASKNGGPWHLYGPQGVREGQFLTPADAVAHSEKLERFRTPLTPDKIQRRSEAYLRDRKNWLDAMKVRLINVEKQKLLQVRQRELESQRANAQAIKDREKFKDVYGAW